MLNIQIDNPVLEKSLRQAYGNDTDSMAHAFSQFAQHLQIQQDVKISIQQLEAGQAIPLQKVIQDIRAKYE